MGFSARVFAGALVGGEPGVDDGGGWERIGFEGVIADG